MLTGVPLDCVGAYDGACGALEPLELLEEPEELELLEELPDEDELGCREDLCELRGFAVPVEAAW